METQKIGPNDLLKAAELLARGEIVAFPTETVYGLGASIFSEKGIEKIFRAKGRPGDNPLIAHICDLSSLDLIAKDIPPLFYRLAERFFPGPLTIVLPKKEQVPSIASGGLDTLAVRMPSHPVALELIKLAGVPLVAPSANLSGKPSSTRVSHVLDDFEGEIAAIVLGEASRFGIESTVIRIVSNGVEILRPGSLPQEEIEEFLKQKVSLFTPKGDYEPLPSPGMKYRHYAPAAKVTLAFSLEEALACRKKMILANGYCLRGDVFPLNAASFYSYLRLADSQGYQEIVIVCDPKTVQNKGLMNRIERSAGL